MYIAKIIQQWPPSSPCPQKQYILGLIETGLSCSCLEQLGWFAGRDPKDCAVGHVAENSPVPSTLGLGGWWRSERSKFLPLDGRRWGCLNLRLLSYWGLNLLGREMKVFKKGGRGGGGKEKTNKQTSITKKNAMWELTYGSNGTVSVTPRLSRLPWQSEMQPWTWYQQSTYPVLIYTFQSSSAIINKVTISKLTQRLQKSFLGLKI